MDERFDVSLRAGERAVRSSEEREACVLHLLFDTLDRTRAERFVLDHAAGLRGLFAADLELRLDERDELAARFRDARDRGQELPEADEGRIDDDEIGEAADLIGLERLRVRSFEDQHAWIDRYAAGNNWLAFYRLEFSGVMFWGDLSGEDLLQFSRFLRVRALPPARPHPSLVDIRLLRHVDVDVLDPSEAPGTGSPEPGGLRVPELLEIVRMLADCHVIGGDLVEVTHAWDPTGRTGIAASWVIREAMLTWWGDAR